MLVLQPDDALDWFQALMALPPEPAVTLPDRDALATLFAQIDFHPLSIGVLAQVLKTRRIAEVGGGLERNLRDEKDPLVASLNLSIERLAPKLREQLPKLGVFQGGALEWVVPMVTQLSAENWAALRLGLEQTGLIRAEALPGSTSPYLRFHPTLTLALWVRLGADDRAALTARHREAYYQFSEVLFAQDSKTVRAVRAIARVELSNLMAAVHAAIDAELPGQRTSPRTSTLFSDTLAWSATGRRWLSGRMRWRPASGAVSPFSGPAGPGRDAAAPCAHRDRKAGADAGCATIQGISFRRSGRFSARPQ